MQYSKEIKKDYYDVVIIGSGLGGLSTAVNLVSKGLSVLVLEKHSSPGGAISTFERNKFTFEAGASVFSGIKNFGPIYDLLKLTKSTEFNLIPINPIYTVKTPNKTINVSSDIDIYINSLVKLFPKYKNQIELFVNDMIKICNSMDFTNQKNRKLSVLIKNNYMLKKYYKLTVSEFVSKYFDNKEIIKIVTSLGTFTTLSINEQSFLTFATIWYAYHMNSNLQVFDGGSKSLINILVKYITNNNSEMVVLKDVSKIILKKSKAIGIKTHCGKIIKSKVIVSTISNRDTYLKLVGEEYLKHKFIQKIKNEYLSNSVLQVFLAIEESENNLLKTTRNFVFNEIDDDKFFESVYTSSYNSKNIIYDVEPKSNSHKGIRLIKVSIICKYKNFKDLYEKNTNDYNKFKENIYEEILNNLEKHIPNLKNRIIYKNISTPVTIENYTRATNGAIHGLAHTVSQSGKIRGTVKTPINNLYRAGQYVYPGGGMPTVTISGKICYNMILKKYFKRNLNKN